MNLPYTASCSTFLIKIHPSQICMSICIRVLIRLKENIDKRGRDYESSIEVDYLKRINDSYLEYLRTQQNFPVKIY